MNRKQLIEFIVGLFMLAGIAGLLLLAFKVSNLSQYSDSNAFRVSAYFDNVGDLKVRAPVTLAGVRIGEVGQIDLDAKKFKAKVILLIDKSEHNLPSDTAAKIFTAGLIGANYIALSPGYADDVLKEGSEIRDTQPAIILENLIGQLMYSLKDSGKDKK